MVRRNNCHLWCVSFTPSTSWIVTDDGAGDLDGLVNGAIQTSWYVNNDACGHDCRGSLRPIRGNRCMDSRSSDAFRLSSAARAQARIQRPLLPTARMKARQFSKIRELVEAVKSAGFLALDEQAKALGLPRSTAWTIRKASHKASGLSAPIINRMLAAPNQDPRIRRGKSCRIIRR
jgi:hypothetical protein